MSRISSMTIKRVKKYIILKSLIYLSLKIFRKFIFDRLKQENKTIHIYQKIVIQNKCKRKLIDKLKYLKLLLVNKPNK